VADGSTVTIYATCHQVIDCLAPGDENGGELVSLVDDTGYNGAFAGTPTVLATAGDNIAFRGVAPAPVDPLAPDKVPNRCRGQK